MYKYLYFKNVLIFCLLFLFSFDSVAVESDFFFELEKASQYQTGYPLSDTLEIVDLSCFVSVYQGLSSMKNGFLVVDVRDKGQFDRFRVPQSINIPLRSLSNKHFIQGKRVLIVSDGLNNTSLAAACSSLKAQGVLDVKVIVGGIVAWVQAGLPLDGHAPSPYEVALISAEQLMNDRNADLFRIISLSESQPLFSGFKGIAEIQLDDTLLSVVKEQGWGEKAVALVGFDAGQFSRYLNRDAPKGVPFFVLNGGEDAFKAMLLKRKEMMHHAQNPPKRHLTCGY